MLILYRVGDLAIRFDVEGMKHLVVVRERNMTSITVQDVYTVDSPMGWSAGAQNLFT